jgi:hypothetical protein
MLFLALNEDEDALVEFCPNCEYEEIVERFG